MLYNQTQKIDEKSILKAEKLTPDDLRETGEYKDIGDEEAEAIINLLERFAEIVLDHMVKFNTEYYE